MSKIIQLDLVEIQHLEVRMHMRPGCISGRLSVWTVSIIWMADNQHVGRWRFVSDAIFHIHISIIKSRLRWNYILSLLIQGRTHHAWTLKLADDSANNNNRHKMAIVFSCDQISNIWEFSPVVLILVSGIRPILDLGLGTPLFESVSNSWHFFPDTVW